MPYHKKERAAAGATLFILELVENCLIFLVEDYLMKEEELSLDKLIAFTKSNGSEGLIRQF